MLYKEELLKFIRVRFEKQASGVSNKWKTNVWNLDLGKKMGNSNFKIMRAHPKRGTFFSR